MGVDIDIIYVLTKNGIDIQSFHLGLNISFHHIEKANEYNYYNYHANK